MSHQVALKVNESLLFKNMRHAFSADAVLGELLQNARRAGATMVTVTYDTEGNLKVEDDGCGIADMQNLLTAAESGWQAGTVATEHPFGLGFLSTLYVSPTVVVDTCHEGRGARIVVDTAALLESGSVEVEPSQRTLGTCVTLMRYGVTSEEMFLVEDIIRGRFVSLARGFPLPVSLNGVDVPRPDASGMPLSGQEWHETEVGSVRLNLGGIPSRYRQFVQGLPVCDGMKFLSETTTVVHLNDTFQAKLPDRRHLMDAMDSARRIGRALGALARVQLSRLLETMGPSAFVLAYAEQCRHWDCRDLLDDVDVVPAEWFIDWEVEHPGCHYDDSFERLRDGESAVLTREEILSGGVYRLPDSDDMAARCWLAAGRKLTLLRDWDISGSHWLVQALQEVKDDDINLTTAGRIGALPFHPWSDNVSELEVVTQLQLSHATTLESFDCHAVAMDGQLIIASKGIPGYATRLVSDYIEDDSFDEDAETRDEHQLELLFLRITAATPEQALEGILRRSGDLTRDGNFADRTFLVAFDAAGALKAVSVAR
ncbi:ATP-binding protein [Rhodanobacter sp. FW106-PBR-R2A-1-13]|uniref:ATP-binding protein n=1 Tax=Rhodanobacter sp. FW106-PBR-R2A-1-13 TaxID=3454845 RepID=UPI0034E5FE4E